MQHALSQMAQWLGLPYAKLPDITLTGIGTDSRTIGPNHLFVALRGEQYDGHQYVAEAEARGASAILASQPVKTSLPVLQVADTLQALGMLAAQHRQKFKIPVVALTGSSGKTTVKDMIVQILQHSYRVLSSQGNYNNEIGVPLTLLNLTSEHQAAVIEMGARRVGDIAYLANMVQPTVSLITNVGVAHIEIFGSVEKIAEGKTEIFAALPATGTAVLCMDDPSIQPWYDRLSKQTKITVSLQSDMNPTLTAEKIQYFPDFTQFTLIIQKKSLAIRLPLPGEHNVMNALLAAGAALGVGAELYDIQQGLNGFRPTAVGRLSIKRSAEGAVLIDDTYNANPASMRAALSVLSGYSGTRIVVMGDMLELGDGAADYHFEMGQIANRLGVRHFFGLGPLTTHAVRGFGAEGKHFETALALSDALKPLLKELQDNAVVLVKGSRGMKMEQVVNLLC